MMVLKINNYTQVKLPRGPVGISMSGGADSTIIAYLAMTQLDVPIHFITMSTVDRGCAQHKTTSDVIARLCDITDNYNVVHHLSFAINAENGIKNIFELSKDLLYKQQIVNSILTGITANPPLDVTDQFTQRENVEPVDRNPDESRALQRAVGWYNPLTNLNKQDIVQIYYDHGVHESLYPVTKSCWTDYGVEPCGECWFCEERSWGEKILPPR